MLVKILAKVTPPLLTLLPPMPPTTHPHSSRPNPHQHTLIALVGSPNCGKSTIFNALTGLRQKIANFPGVTVEPKVGRMSMSTTDAASQPVQLVQLVDLPGVYSMIPKTLDEELTVAVLQGTPVASTGAVFTLDDRKNEASGMAAISKPDAAIFVIEGTNIEKSLFLYAQFARFKIPTIVAVTMIDTIQANGGVLDDIELERQLGVPVVGIVGHKGVGLDEVREHIEAHDFHIPLLADNSVLTEQSSIEQQHQWAREVARLVAHIPDTDTLSRRLDAVLLHPVAGPLVFLGVMLLFFQSIFTWATPLMDSIDALVGYVQAHATALVPQALAGSTLAADILRSFVGKGVIAGVGSVLVFMPQIVILTLFISLLEDFGYLSRAAFLVDRIMGSFGLQGRSFVPLLGSFACAIPGIMSARIIPSQKDRLATILVAPLMTCSARLPVYILLIAAFIPNRLFFGFLSQQGLVLMALYAVAAVSGLAIAKLFKSTLFKGSKLPFLMELPPYRFPAWKNVGLTVLNRMRAFLTSAGTTILFLSIVLWALGEFPHTEAPQGASPLVAETVQLENSALGMIGKTIQPIFAPIGFDWKVTIGVLGSFAAREVFVSVMGQVYSTDVSESDETLRSVLQRSISLPAALSIIAFYVYALQCMSTIAVMKRETGSWRYPAFAFAYTLALAYGSSWLVYWLAGQWW
jgi:ferrous iron transport protein B